MFYISGITLLFFVFAFIDLIASLIVKAFYDNYLWYGQIAVFGFILHTIIGALYQIVPNSQQTTLKFPFLSKIVFILSVISSLYLYMGKFDVAYFFIAAVVLIFTFHISFIIKDISSLTVKYILASIIFTALSGVSLILSIEFSNIPQQVAFHLFTIGGMINAVLGVQTAWIPMIYMQPLGKTKVGKLIINSLFYIHQFIVISIILSFWIGDYKLLASFAIIELAIILLFLKYIFFDSIKPQIKLYGIPYTVKFFISGHLFLILGILTAHIIGISHRFELIDYHVTFVIYGFGIFTILGGVLHLTPRMIFNLKQNKKSGFSLSRGKLEFLFKIILGSYLMFIILNVYGFSFFASLFYAVVMLIAFIGLTVDFYKLYKS